MEAIAIATACAHHDAQELRPSQTIASEQHAQAELTVTVADVATATVEQEPVARDDRELRAGDQAPELKLTVEEHNTGAGGEVQTITSTEAKHLSQG